jgi:hypothetical protein
MFPLALVVVVLHGYLARWVAGSFVSEDHKDVAGFSFVLGMAYLALGQINDFSTELMLGASMGYIAGLTVVWYLFFKREKADG